MRIGLLEGVYTLTASVLRHGDTDNPFGTLIRHTRFNFLADQGNEWAARRDSFAGAATTVGVIEFKESNLSALTGKRKEEGVAAAIGEV